MAKAFSGLGVTAGLAADRAALTGVVAGQQFFETDTKKTYVYSGSAWIQENDYTLGAMVVDSSGRVTLPYQPSFLATRSADVAHNCSSQTNPVPFNATTYNIGSGYNTANGRFTAPVSGTYIFNAGIYCSVNIEQMWFIVDGARERSFVLDAANANMAGSGIIYLNAGQWLGMTPWCGGNASVTIYSNFYHTYFRGALLI